MKHILSAVFLAVFGLAVSASAEPNDFKVTQEELQGLEVLLQQSELQLHPLTDDDFDDDDDDDDDDGDDEPSLRKWNPISWIKDKFKKLKNKCVCENNKCECHFKLKLFRAKASFSAEVLQADKKVQLTLSLEDKTLVNKRFDLNRDDSICGHVPVPALSFLKFCFNQDSDIDENSVVTSCSSVDFRIGSTPGAVVQFRCLELKDGQFSFGGYKKLEKSQMLVLKAKNPFKAAIKLYQKAMGKKN